MKNILAIFFIIGAFALFFFYSNPHYEETANLKQDILNYSQALENAKALRTIRDEQYDNYIKILPSQQKDLEKLIPDNVDNIKLIIDMSRIANRFGLEMRDISIDQSQNAQKTAAAKVASTNEQGTGTISLTFSINASYDRIMQFIDDLEHSLRLVDITSLSFNATKEGTYNFSMTLRTYWLK